MTSGLMRLEYDAAVTLLARMNDAVDSELDNHTGRFPALEPTSLGRDFRQFGVRLNRAYVERHAAELKRLQELRAVITACRRHLDAIAEIDTTLAHSLGAN